MLGIGYWSTNGMIDDANDALLEIVGYSREDLRAGAVDWRKITPPEYAHIDEAVLAELKERSFFTPFEKEYIRKDGRRVPVLVGGRTFPDDPTRGLFFVLDITDRVEARKTQSFLIEASLVLGSSLDYEEILRRFARLAVPRIADWCLVDLREPDGTLRRLTVVNRDPEQATVLVAQAERRGIDPDAPHGTPNVIRTGQAELVSDLTDDMLAAYARDDQHYQLLRSLGFCSLMIVPLLARGQIHGAIALVAAESGRHYTQADLDVAQDLARRAALAVDNALLYREAQQALQVRDEFMSVAAHELRTPITTIAARAEMLRRRLQRASGLEERDERALLTLQEQAQRLDRLVSALLDVSRLQLDRLEIERRPVDMGQLAQRLAGELGQLAERHTIRYETDPGRLMVEGNELRLEQVLQNLLQNAVKYSPGGGEILIDVRRRDASICIAVADHGIGIPAQALEQLFTRFFRAGNVHSTVSGMGIGLYIVKELVMLHGGTIDVESVEGAGATFTVCLPALPDCSGCCPGQIA